MFVTPAVKRRISLLVSFVILAFLLTYFLYVFLLHEVAADDNDSISNKNKILHEIDSLILPTANQSITVSDLSSLSSMVKGDPFAEKEVSEIELLTKYREYNHVGHSLFSLYEYEKKGKESICPGHSLAHALVFYQHGENATALQDLREANSSLKEWRARYTSENETTRVQTKYYYYLDLFAYTLHQIENNNINFSSSDIDTLSDAPCRNP